MALASGRTLTRSGAYLLGRAKSLAYRLAQDKKPGNKNEVQDGYLIRATSFNGIGIGVVIDPPCALTLGIPEYGSAFALSYQVRDWYDSQYGTDNETVAFSALQKPDAYPISRALYSSPEASAATGPGGLFPVSLAPWCVVGSEGRYAVHFARVIVYAAPGSVTFNGTAPFGVPTSAPYGLTSNLHIGRRTPLEVQVNKAYLQSVAGSLWGFGPHISKLVDLRAGLPCARSVMLRKGSSDLALISSTYKHSGVTTMPGELLTFPRPGLFVLAHSQKQMKQASGEFKFSNGRLWQLHIDLANEFPILDTGPFICKPFNNNDYTFTGGGNPALASEAWKVWVNGYYSGSVAPTNIGKMPSFINRLCAVASADRIHIAASVTFFTAIDRQALGHEAAPLLTSQLFCCAGMLRIELDHAGNVISKTLSELDSTAGAAELAYDGLPGGRSGVSHKTVTLQSLIDLDGDKAELVVEWASLRVNGQPFHTYPNSIAPSNGEVNLAASGWRFRWRDKDYFVSAATAGVLPWGKYRYYISKYYYLNGIAQSETPTMVQISKREVAFIGFKISPMGRIALCVLNIETGALSIRSDIGAGTPIAYGGAPYPGEVLASSAFQQPPCLSVAQRAIFDADDNLVCEATLLFSFAPFKTDTLVSRDSGATWQTHITGANSQYGIYFAPNALRPDYETGTAALTQQETT